MRASDKRNGVAGETEADMPWHYRGPCKKSMGIVDVDRWP